MSLFDKVIINIYYIIDRISNKYCDCGEILLDDICDYCGNKY